jgi:lipopolysaccharide/colanic/teichoic acid biosynthesis glycosyltransferase
MSWEQSLVNQELTNAEALESGLSFTASKENAIVASWDCTAARTAAKRLYDLFFATFGLILLSPLLLLIALAIKLSDRGPVMYRQRRIGQYGIPFFIWKFRTMVLDAEICGIPVTSNDDRRISTFGVLLRMT